MRIFIINMPQHADRRESSAQKLKAHGLSFEFFDGISGEVALREAAFADYDEDEFLLNTGRSITMGEVGCFASHRALWAICHRLNEPIMIMEDDFDLLDGFADALHSAAEVTECVGFLRLQTDRSARKHAILRSRDFLVSRFTKAPHSTMCYSISPDAARCFLAASRTFDAPVDVFIKKFWEHGQALYALTPYTVAPSVMSVDTTIEGRIKPRKELNVQFRRFLRKGRWYWKRWLYNVDYRLLSTPDLEITSELSANTGLTADKGMRF